MSNLRFRLAKPSDAKQIANCHWHVRDRYSQGIFLSLGKGFLKTYYEIVLNDPWEVLVCAERVDGTIIGFCSATLDSRAQAQRLKKNKFRLGMAAIKAVLLKPKLIKELWLRYNSLGNNATCHFVYTDGVRGEYWCWLKQDDSLMSIELDKAKNEILYDLGCRELFFEVDKNNKQVYNYHIKVNNAEPIDEFSLPDGRKRVLFKQILKKG